eukprot:m.489231 g.489231  ORF g.489231 m.489231 type:complete len:569 (+) comp26517_c0_seq1:88-1794(+)
MSTIRVNVWAAPRSMSTAVMYSFAQRDDTTVVDEPLYAHHLSKNSHLDRPYKEELLKAQNPDGNEVVKSVIMGDSPSKVRVFKHMAKHLFSLDESFLGECVNIVLLRNPAHLVHSFSSKASPSLDETGLLEQTRLVSKLRSMGKPAIVVDSQLLVKDPKAVLTELCNRIGIEFQEAMMSWPEGPKPYDGLWASHWYAGVHKSTCFTESTSYATIAPELVPLVEECYPLYLAIRQHAIGANAPIHKFGTHIEDHGLQLDVLPDERNRHLLVWVGHGLVPRAFAGMSVFDSTVQGGDAVWEGGRVYDGRIFHLDHHIRRMLNSAKAMAFVDIPSIDFIKHAIFATLAANGMRDGVHMRFTLSRGEKTTSSMNPKFNVYGAKLVVVAEWKPIVGVATYDNSKGVSLITAANRRNPPQCVDSKIHHCNLINNILPKVQANLAGAADAIMLDLEGFVSETNATNLFCVRRGVLVTPHADYCLPGITRETIMALAPTIGLKLEERRVSLSEFHSADEVFTTGTMGELTPVVEIDGRSIGDGKPGPVTAKIMEAFRALTDLEDEAVIVPPFTSEE